MYTFIFDEVFYSFVSLCVVINSVEFSDCCYITSYKQMINKKKVLFPVHTELDCVMSLLSLSSFMTE